MDSTFDDDKRMGFLTSGQTIYLLHHSEDCFGEFCPVHRPSDHALRHLPLWWGEEVGSFLRGHTLDDAAVDPDDYVLNSSGHVILRNSATCGDCGTELESKNRHDFRTCSCGGLSVDGGHQYLRRVGANCMDTSIVYYKE